VREFPALAAVRGAGHVVTFFGQAAAQQFQHSRFVFYDKQLHRVGLPHSGKMRGVHFLFIHFNLKIE
jgi:hypothetical protein